MTQMIDVDDADEEKRAAIRDGYDFGVNRANSILHNYPEEETLNVREAIQGYVEAIYDDPEERVEMLPYVVYGFRQGTIDWLYRREDRYAIGQ